MLPAIISQLQAAAPYLALGALGIALIAVAYAIALRTQLRRLSSGGGSIEDTLKTLLRESKEMQEFRGELEEYLKHVEGRLRTSVRGMGVVRFNPFANGQGGNQSFAVALLDEKGNGVVFSTLYARDRVGVYAKPIESGASSFELSEEEKEALDKALKSIGPRKK
jgi:hypothetical protein